MYTFNIKTGIKQVFIVILLPPTVSTTPLITTNYHICAHVYCSSHTWCNFMIY